MVDYWCRDCQDWFRAPHNPDMHAPGQPCPKGHGHNTYRAYTELGEVSREAMRQWDSAPDEMKEL